MILGRRVRLGAVILTLISPALLGVFSPSHAGPSSSPPIDKDFETALSKFLGRRFLNQIGATAEQREKLSKIMAETQEETRPQREELHHGLLDLSSMMADAKNSDEQIREKAQELRSLHEKLQDKRLSAIMEARKILSAEQRQQIQGRIYELLNGGNRLKKIGMLIQSGSETLLSDQ